MKLIETLFSRESGFDKKNKLNRSNQIVPRETLETIENGLSIEDLEKMGLPIFKYKTQITVHGQFDEIKHTRIGHYKNLLQNQNKSIGIKWNAIDYQKKRKIQELVAITGWGRLFDSTNDMFYISKRVFDRDEALKIAAEYREKYEKINFTGVYATSGVHVYANMGAFYIQLEIHLKAVRAESLDQFVESMTGKTVEELKKLIEEQKKSAELEREQTRLEWAKEREKNEALINKARAEVNYVTEVTKHEIKHGDMFLRIDTLCGELRYEYVLYTIKGRDRNFTRQSYTTEKPLTKAELGNLEFWGGQKTAMKVVNGLLVNR